MHIDSSEVRRLQGDLGQAPAEVRAKTPGEVSRTLSGVQRSARGFAPVDDGELSASIGVDVDPDGMGGGVGPTADHGDEIEYGAAPHVIRARGGGKLAFQGSDGQLVFLDEVNHPGNPPQPYMAPAFELHEPDLEQALGDLGEDIL